MNAKQSALNLRKSNFTFGYDAPEFQSKYQQTFSDAPDIALHIENMKSITKIGNQKTNIKIDNDQGQKDHYLSTAKQTYTQNPYQNVKLTESQRKEISASHTVFGTDHENYYTSETKQNFKEQQITDEVFKDKKEHANSLRKHAYTFGGIKKYYDTTYQVNLCKIKNEDFYQNKIYMNQQINNQIKDHKQPHIIMGFQNNLQQVLQEKQDIQQLPVKKNSNVSIVYGNDSLDYISTKQKFTCGQPTETIKLTGDMVKDLRSCHFPMGYDKTQYETENAQNYQEKKYEYVPEMTNGKNTHLKFEQFRDYTTMNNIYFPQKPNAKENMIINGSNNVHLGFDKDNWISEQHQQFDKKNNDNNNFKNTIQDLKKISLEQCQLKDDWGSVMKQHYPNHQQYKPNVLSDEIKKEIRVQHFTYGSQQDDNITSNKEIGKTQRQNNNEDREMFTQIKNHVTKGNINLGKDQPDYISYYSKQFSNRT